MKVLFVASEMTPLAKIGGLGDVIGSLPQALKRLGVDARVILPYYEAIHSQKIKARKLFELDDGTIIYEVAQNFGAQIYLVQNAEHLSRGPIYADASAFVGSESEIERFAFFSQKVFEVLQDKRFFQPDIVHCNDWHTGLLVRLVRERRLSQKTIFTIHNLANQGISKGKNLMEEGIVGSDLVSTVSPTYAKEILTKEYGSGLEKVLQKRNRQKKLTGILNGIDYGFWPSYARDKAGLQRSLKLRVGEHLPIFAVVSRLTYQKGINLVIPLVKELVKKYGAQFVFLGRGEDRYEKQLKDLAIKYPKSLFVKIAFDENLAHKIYPNSDFFLMPSLFEPCGLGQMVAMRYGTIPIVRSTGGLKDSVNSGKTGFVFKQSDAGSLNRAIRRALKIFDDRDKLAKMRGLCMQQDFSWDTSAAQYKKLYGGLIKS